MTTPGRHAQPRERPLLRAWLNTRYRVADVAGDVRWYSAKTTRALKRAAARWRHRDDDNDVPRPGGAPRLAGTEPRMGVSPQATEARLPSTVNDHDGSPGPGHFGRSHISGTVHDEPVWYQPHAAPDIPRGFWSPPALRDWLPELLEWALTAPIGEIRAAAA